MIATVPSATLFGVDGRPVTVEVHVAAGLPGFTIVGQPDSVCREARDRVRAALLSTGLPWPQRKVTVNLAPSGVRKGGGGLDLAICVGVLVAFDQLGADTIAGHGLVAATRRNRAGKVVLALARATRMTPSSNGWRRLSSTTAGNSPISSRNSTPRWAIDISPGRIHAAPPPTSDTIDALW